MKEYLKAYVERCLPELVDTTICSPILIVELCSKDLLGKYDCEQLLATPTNSERAYHLYRILMTRNDSYEPLIEALLKTSQSAAASILQRGVQNHQEELPTMMTNSSSDDDDDNVPDLHLPGVLCKAKLGVKLSASLGIAMVTLVALIGFTVWFMGKPKPNHGQVTLTAVKCVGALSAGRAGFSILYDRNDSIYIFGGGDGFAMLNNVEKYSISEDTTEIVVGLPESDYTVVGAVVNKLGGIFYLSKSAKDIHIYQFFPGNRTFVEVSSFRGADGNRFAAIQSEMDAALLFIGGEPFTSILSLNLSTLEPEHIAQLEWASSPTAIWMEEKRAAYIFDNFTKLIQKYNGSSSNSTETLAVRVPVKSMSNYGVVCDGRFGYLVGYIAAADHGPADNGSSSLAKFDPETETFAFIHHSCKVEGYPRANDVVTVYVKKLNRIYMFGGWTTEEDMVYRAEIYYVDLDPLN